MNKKHRRKNAYRYLLYQAMLDIRPLANYGPLSKNPVVWYREYLQARRAGAIADWLHNLAYYAARDFQNFDEERFWHDYDRLCERFEEIGPGQYMDYRARFERALEDN